MSAAFDLMLESAYSCLEEEGISSSPLRNSLIIKNYCEKINEFIDDEDPHNFRHQWMVFLLYHLFVIIGGISFNHYFLEKKMKERDASNLSDKVMQKFHNKWHRTYKIKNGKKTIEYSIICY